MYMNSSKLEAKDCLVCRIQFEKRGIGAGTSRLVLPLCVRACMRVQLHSQTEAGM